MGDSDNAFKIRLRLFLEDIAGSAERAGIDAARDADVSAPRGLLVCGA